MKSTAWMRWFSGANVALGSIALIFGAACGDSATGATSGATPSGGAGGSGSGVSVGASGTLSGDPSTGAGDACVAAKQAAQITPLDVYLMLDQSGSMVGTYDQAQYGSCTAAFEDGGITPLSRWNDTTAALNAFMGDPESAGISVGLGFFPPKQAQQGGAKCEDNKCDISAYSTPPVPIAPLPGNATAIASELDFTPCSCNGTPMSAALQGAVAYAQQQATDHPDHRVVVILATDGVPNGNCSGSHTDGEGYTPPSEVAHDAYVGSPSIPVYVIGVGPDLISLNELAQEGGTGSAFLIDGNQGTEQALIAALNEIRGQALSCEITIPAAPAGQTLDPAKVNVIYSPGDGAPDATLSSVPDASGCAESPESWYYDDPVSPTKVILCAAACEEIQGDSGAELNVGFGCETVVAVPE